MRRAVRFSALTRPQSLLGLARVPGAPFFFAIPGMSERHCEEGLIAFAFSQSGLEAETFQGRRVFRRDGIAVVSDHDLGGHM